MDNVLKAVLNAREERWRIRLALAERGAVLTMTQNLPGPDKLLPRWLSAHRAAVKGLALSLSGLGFDWTREAKATAPSLRRLSAAGAEAHFVFPALGVSAADLKRAAVDFEESYPAGRLLDLDVMSKGGALVERETLGLPPRLCLLCTRPAKECASRRRHSLEELMKEADRLLDIPV